MMITMIKTGNSVPTINDLNNYQLGFCSGNKNLYINDNGNIVNLTDIVGPHYVHLESLFKNGRIRKNLYCDNVGGDDDNDGLSKATPVKTLIKLQKIQQYYNKFYTCYLYLKGSSISYGDFCLGGYGVSEFEQFVYLGNYDGNITLDYIHVRGAEGHLAFFCEKAEDTFTITLLDNNNGLINFPGCKVTIQTFINRIGRTNFSGEVIISSYFQSFGGFITLSNTKFTVGPTAAFFRIFSGCFVSCGEATINLQMANNTLVSGYYPIEIYGYLDLESCVSFSKNQIAYVGHGGFVNKRGKTIGTNATFTEKTAIQV
jgi:hypothetical protein